MSFNSFKSMPLRLAHASNFSSSLLTFFFGTRGGRGGFGLDIGFGFGWGFGLTGGGLCQPEPLMIFVVITTLLAQQNIQAKSNATWSER